MSTALETAGKEVLVVRGGSEWNLVALREQAIAADKELGYMALSVFCSEQRDDESWEDTVRRIVMKGNIHNGKVRVASMSRMTESGFELRKTLGTYHHSVVLSTLTDEELYRMRGALGNPVPNPRWRNIR